LAQAIDRVVLGLCTRRFDGLLRVSKRNAKRSRLHLDVAITVEPSRTLGRFLDLPQIIVMRLDM
jgi:hypothetical protein